MILPSLNLNPDPALSPFHWCVCPWQSNGTLVAFLRRAYQTPNHMLLTDMVVMSDLPEIFTRQSFSPRVCKTSVLINGNSSTELRDKCQHLAVRDSLPCYKQNPIL